MEHVTVLQLTFTAKIHVVFSSSTAVVFTPVPSVGGVCDRDYHVLTLAGPDTCSNRDDEIPVHVC